MQKGVIRKRRSSPPSEYARQLHEKQGLKQEYSLKERKLKRYVKKILSKSRRGDVAELLLGQLEKRLDNVVFRMGMAQTRKHARQLVSHGHFLINQRRVTIPSYCVKKGDFITLHPSSHKEPAFEHLKLALKKYQPPAWIQLEKERVEATIVGEPTVKELASQLAIPLLFEFYSK